MTSIDPKVLRENIARSRNAIRKGDFVSGLHMLARALIAYPSLRLYGPQRMAVENAFIEVFNECNRNSGMHSYLTPPGSSEPAQLRFIHGREEALANLFSTIATRIEQAERNANEEQVRLAQERRVELGDRAKHLLMAGELSKGRSFAHKLIEEFGANDPHLHLSTAALLNTYNMPLDAAIMLEAAIETFPKESALYTLAIEIYTQANEVDKAEAIYRKIFRQFGAPPQTMCSLARLFLSAGRRQKAEDLMYQLLQNHPGHEEANAILAQVQRRGM